MLEAIPAAQKKSKPRLIFLALLAALTAGMLYGVLLAGGGSEAMLSSLRIFTAEYAAAQRGQSLMKSFFDAFLSGFFFLLAPYLLGYSAIGQPAAFLVPFFKGLGLGAFLGSLYRSYGFTGFLYSALLVVPYTLAALLAILVACRESVRLSNLFFSCILGNRGRERVSGSALRLYHIKFLVLLAIVVVSAVVYTVCVLLFSRFFHF